MKLIDDSSMADYLKLPKKEDGEVIGLNNSLYPDREPHTVHWCETSGEPYVSGDTIAQWGVHNLNEAERERCGFSEIDVEIATEFYAREGHGISLAELNNEVAPRTRAP